ncbi:hypothetical protein [Streptomyces carpinensis]|uniref:Uncharacterized protein n=1 Tax=Streptomyces carpinensis TaxID=66369 RepID=A0ABV1W0E6_9ACTN|nr:hypothetical protein [Streptomyces carpinensis]
MPSTTTVHSPAQLAAAVLRVADIVQARTEKIAEYADGRALLDNRLLLQVAYDLAPTAAFDMPAFSAAWKQSLHDGTRPARKALYMDLWDALAARLPGTPGQVAGCYTPAEVRAVAYALAPELRPAADRLTQGLADELNLAARFLAKGLDEEGTVPCLENGGAQVYASWEPGEGLCVSLHLDSGEVPDVLANADGSIPVRITVNGKELFRAA